MEREHDEDYHQGVKTPRGSCYKQQKSGRVYAKCQDDPGIQKSLAIIQRVQQYSNRDKGQDPDNKGIRKKWAVINKMIKDINSIALYYFELMYKIFFAFKR